MSERYPVIQVEGLGGALTVRDGLILCFFIRHPHRDVADKIWAALQAYLNAIPNGSLAWYVDMEGEYQALDESGWAYIQQKLLNRPQAHACHVNLLQVDVGVEGYNFEYDGYRLDSMILDDEKAACSISFSLPTEYLLDHGADKVRELALELSRELPYSFGYASLAFVSPGGAWTSVRREMLHLIDRYRGIDLYHLLDTSRLIGTGARGAYWLTFLGQPLLAQLGGLETLRRELDFPEVSFEPLEGERVLLRLGEWPSAMDVREFIHRPHFTALARLLAPYLPDEQIGLTSIFDKRNMGRWLRRYL